MSTLRSLSTRFARLESRTKNALFEQRLRDAVIGAMPTLYAGVHATTVLAVWRYGTPQIDEPLCHAYHRAMGELGRLFKTEIEQWLEEENISRVQLGRFAVSSEIMIFCDKREGKLSKVANGLLSVPAWLVKFTDVERDAGILRDFARLELRLPNLSRAPKLGGEARKDRGRWPLLPQGTIDAGGPCDEPDWYVRTEELLRRNTSWKFPD